MRCFVAFGFAAVLILSASADSLESAATPSESGMADTSAVMEITDMPDTDAVETVGEAPPKPLAPPSVVYATPSTRNGELLRYTTPTAIKLHTRTSITGCVFFFVGLGVEWGALFPWSLQMAHRSQDLQRRIDAYNDGNGNYAEEEAISSETSALLGESVLLLVAGIPVSLSKTLGASYACAGASRAYGAYTAGVDPGTPDIRVWKPYMAGWVLTACSGALGVVSTLWALGGAQAPAQIGYIGTALSIGRDATWAAASIMSVAYAVDKRSAVEHRVSLAPYGTNGLALSVRF